GRPDNHDAGRLPGGSPGASAGDAGATGHAGTARLGEPGQRDPRGGSAAVIPTPETAMEARAAKDGPAPVLLRCATALFALARWARCSYLAVSPSPLYR